MNYLGVNFPMNHTPKLDPGFVPFGIWMDAYLQGAKQPIAIAVERNGGQIAVRNTFIDGTPEMAAADYRYVERMVKFLLWSIGGFRVYICGAEEIGEKLNLVRQTVSKRRLTTLKELHDYLIKEGFEWPDR